MEDPRKRKLPTNRPLDALDVTAVAAAVQELLDRLPEEERFRALGQLGYHYRRSLPPDLAEAASEHGVNDIETFLTGLVRSGTVAPEGVREEHVWAYLTGLLARAAGYINLQGEPEEDQVTDAQPRVPDAVLRRLFGGD